MIPINKIKNSLSLLAIGVFVLTSTSTTVLFTSITNSLSADSRNNSVGYSLINKQNASPENSADIKIGKIPSSIVVNSNTHRIYVANEIPFNSVFVIDEDNNTLMKTTTISKFSCRININAIIKPSCSLAIDENKNK